MSPAGPPPPSGALAGDWELLRRWRSGRGFAPVALPTRHPRSRIFARGWAKSLPSFPANGAGDGDGAEPVAGWHHALGSQHRLLPPQSLFRVLPGLPKAFLHPVKIIGPINARHGNGLSASFSRQKTLAQQDCAGAERSRRCLRPGGDAAGAAGGRGSGKGL